MNRSRSVEAMLDAGITSLKIEGRLKDIAYVKNTTAYYSQLLDKIISRRPHDYRRASYGLCHTTFEPNLDKTFNRGFTEYFLHGRTEDVASIHTPKAVGEPVGTVKEIKHNYILVSGTGSFHNGDGICYFDKDGTLQGFRVNKAENNKLYPHQMPQSLAIRTPLFRNHDAAFEAAMLRPTPQRTIGIEIKIEDIDEGFRLTATTQQENTATLEVKAEHQQAVKPQTDRIIAELSKTGGTGYEVTKVTTAFSQDFFIPASMLSQWRRELIEKMRELFKSESSKVHSQFLTPNSSLHSAPFTENISNRAARQFYEEQGTKEIEPAFEISLPKGNVTLMTCRHCIKYSLGLCVKYDRDNKSKILNLKSPISLVLPDGRRFPLEFDCHKCEMRVTARI